MGNETMKFIYGAGKYGKLLLHCFIDFMKIDSCICLYPGIGK